MSAGPLAAGSGLDPWPGSGLATVLIVGLRRGRLQAGLRKAAMRSHSMTQDPVYDPVDVYMATLVGSWVDLAWRWPIYGSFSW